MRLLVLVARDFIFNIFFVNPLHLFAVPIHVQSLTFAIFKFYAV